jgi:phosphoglycerate dehydrogenase-like enzyme
MSTTRRDTNPIVIAVTFPLDAAALARIRAIDPRIEVLDLGMIAGRKPPDAETRARLLTEIARAEIMLGPNRIPVEYFDGAVALRWFQSINAGVERLDRDGLLRREFIVTTGSGLAAGPIAEYVLGAMVMLAKGLHTSVRHQQERRWEFRFTSELAGKTIGIVGLGEIGRETARRARAFGMRIVASRRRAEPGGLDPDCDRLVTHSGLGELLSESDYVVVAVPLTAETTRLIGARELAAMKRSAFLINVARGEIIDQQALIDALRAGTLAGAALDVTDPEPLPADNPLWGMENVILTPHVSGAVEGYGHRAVEFFAENLGRYLRGERLAHIASPELGY